MEKIKEKLKNVKSKTLERVEQHKQKAKLLKEFKEFLKEYKVVGLAIGFVMGIASTALVKSLVDNVIMPLISPLVPAGKWEEAVLTIWKFNMKWGAFVSELINFLIIAFVVFLIAKFIMKEEKVGKK